MSQHMINITNMTTLKSVLPPHDDNYFVGLPHIRYEKKSCLYTVKYFPTLEVYTCSCKDFNYRRRKTNEMCKHIEYINNLDEICEAGINNGISWSKQGFFESKSVVMIDKTDSKSDSKTDSKSATTMASSPTSTSVPIKTHRKSQPPRQRCVDTSALGNASLSAEETCQMLKDIVFASKSMLSTVDKLVDKLHNVKVE